MTSGYTPLADAISIWDRLKKSGLAPSSYDSDFVVAFAYKLQLRADRKIESELRRLNPSIVDVLAAFVACCEPFDGMAQDVWKMFVEADARFSDENLQIAFDFSKRQPNGFKFDLQHFKAFHEEFVRFQELVAKYPLTQNFLWGLAQLVTRLTRSEDQYPPSRDAELWGAAYDRGEWVTPIPSIPATGDAQADLCLREARNVVAAVVELLVSNGVAPHEGSFRYRERTGLELDDRPPDDPLLSAVRADSDRWTRSMIVQLDQLALWFTGAGPDPEAAATIGQIKAYLQSHHYYEDRENLTRMLEEFLKSPAVEVQAPTLWPLDSITDR